MPYLSDSEGHVPSQPTDVPIAIIGLSCRLPGEASTPASFWESLLKARSEYSKVPPERWETGAFYDPLKKRLNTSHVEGGHFLKQNIAAFDASFFNINQNEAQAIDPQQRMMLEVSYEAIENAGISLDSMAGSKTGCFIGAFTNDYREILFRDPDAAPKYAVTGAGAELLSNRLSWFYDLRGPSVTMGTACSSGLVALHLACQSIRTGESNMALVGATNLLLDPMMFIGLTRQQFLSPDGLCKSFDASGDGYSRGEGVVALMLKPVDQAIRDGDNIRAVIRGTGMNQDGKTKGITVPSTDAQAELIRTTYESAGIDFKDTHYFEAHGPGTKAGDPVELEAISRTVSKGRSERNKLIVGSVKSNIGHLESVAGLAGLIKSVYILETGIIPANLHFQTPNPSIPFDKWKIMVPTKKMAWPAKGPRRISVNSFGYGGTNAHAVLEDVEHHLQEPRYAGILSAVPGHARPSLKKLPEQTLAEALHLNGNDEKDVKEISVEPLEEMLFVFSAHDQSGLKRLKESTARYLRSKKRTSTDSIDEMSLLRDLAFTLSNKRTKHPWKTYITASTIDTLVEKLEAADSASPSGRPIAENPRLGFVFTGQGAQWARMGIELLRYPVFRDSVKAAGDYLCREEGCHWNASEELLKNDATSNIDLPEYSQSLCTVVQVALVDLLSSWNITPVSVVGHSSGEIAAAYCIGAITKEAAWKIAFHRGVLSSQLKTLAPELSGAMMAVGASEAQAQEYISQVTQGQLVVACVNSPSSVTVSGDATGIHQLGALLKEQNVFHRKLKVNTAYHSPHMQTIASMYMHSLSDVQAQESFQGRQMFSSVTGDLADPLELGAMNWVRNLVSPVLFTDSVSALVQTDPEGRPCASPSVDIFIELGPHPALRGPVNQILDSLGFKGIEYRSVLQRGQHAVDSALSCCGDLAVLGVAVDIEKINNAGEDAKPQMLTDLPPYAWNHSRTFWGESRLAQEFRLRKFPSIGLLGAPYPSLNSDEALWRGFLRIEEEPWIEDHQIQSSILYPAAGYLVMAIEAARQMSDINREVRDFRLRDVIISSAVVLKEGENIECICQLRPHKTGTRGASSTWLEFTISTCPAGTTQLKVNCTGLILVEYQTVENSAAQTEISLENKTLAATFRDMEKDCVTKEASDDFYKELAAVGLVYGPTFQCVTSVAHSAGKSVCDVQVPNTNSIAAAVQAGRPHIIHPATLDAIFHLSFAALKGGTEGLKEAMVPTAIDEVIIAANTPFQAGSLLKGFSTAAKHGMKELKADMVMLDDMIREPLVTVRGFTCAAFSGSGIDGFDDDEKLKGSGICSKLVWKPCLDLLSNAEQVELVNRIGTFGMKDEEAKHFKKSEYLALMFMRQIVDRVKPSSVAPEAHLRRLYEWMKHQQELISAGTHPLQHSFGDDLRVQIAKDVNSEFHSVDSDDQKLYLTSTVLTQILLGQLKAEQLMVEESLVDRYLWNTPGVRACANKLAEYVDMVLFSQPASSILELGGASGGVAAKILDKRQSIFTNYTYACPTEAIKTLAEETLKPWSSALKFVVDDLNTTEKKAAEAQKYDIVIAPTAFFGADSIEFVLADLKRMLNPGGRLFLIETTSPGVQLSCALGCLKSWWSRTPDNADLAASDRTSPLKRAGFDILMETPDFEDKTIQQFSLIVAQVAGSASDIAAPDKDVVIIEPRDPTRVSAALGSRIALDLSEASYQCSLIKWGDKSAAHTTRKFIVLAEVEQALLPTMSEDDFLFLHNIILKASDILWVTSHDQPTASMASGLARSVQNESASLRFRTLQAMSKSLELPDRLASHIVKLTTCASAETEFVETEGILHVSRALQDGNFNEELSAYLHGGKVELMPLNKCHGPQRIHIGAPGMLDSLQFESDESACSDLQPGQVEIEVRATGINFRDVMVAMGQIPDRLFGFEAAGIITRVASDVTSIQPGQRVSCLGHGAHRTHYRSPAMFCQLLPDDITFEEGAGLPLVHATAYHAMINIMRVQKGQSILIHAAAGGVGQAAIQLAQHHEMEIFATVGSADKRALLQETYGIPDDHIFHSRDTSFAKAVKRMTGGRGVDCILNSLAGEQLRQTWHCIAPFGTFVEIGLKDILGNTRLDMRPFIQDATFSFLNLQHVTNARPELMATILQGTFDLLRRKVTRPVFPLTAFPVSDMENAFRLMQSGRHIGKLVLSFTPDSVVKVHRNPSVELRLKANGTYIVVGGFGGIGNSLARLLADHGAKHICILSRSGPSSEEARILLEDLKKQGVTVTAYSCNIADGSELKAVIDRCRTNMPPIKGVFQCAMVLRDVLFENMTHKQWTESIQPKVQGTWNLHQSLPRDLDFFIILSSFAGVFGNRGQANYAAAGAFEDAFAHYRRSLGLRAVSIDLGIMRDVGVLATGSATGSRDLKDWEEPFGIRQTDLHALIRKIMESETAGDDSVEAQILTGFATGGGVAAAGIRRPFYYDDPRFSVLEWTGHREGGAANSEDAQLSLKARLSSAVSVEGAYEAATQGIVEKVASMMQTSAQEVDSSRPLHSYGVDSLVAVEIRNWLTKEASADVTVFDILAAVPITSLAQTVVSKSTLVAKG
ncbi:hypothetical protein PV08_09493 [Exophiala spinifera]|uniref:Uncharacterized protein n=1 Tax=Exophiala spinifera TaxID=91928 RepID=A0A0D1ZGY4_9EURO|nr:uncharacterized protein PV08_09493 [Exophiala spinifera]KIW12217.1 hypothetical protein PV08_09493 [Exophiala spinifera]